MNRNDFLHVLKAFTEEAVKDLLLPVRPQKSTDEPTLSPAGVYLMRLPDSSTYEKKVPYIIHQIVASEDSQKDGNRTQSFVTVRTIFCVWDRDEQEGALELNELVDRVRMAFLHTRLIGGRYFLDLDESDIKYLYYTEDIAPYYAGEMESVWRGESVEMGANNVDVILNGGTLP